MNIPRFRILCVSGTKVSGSTVGSIRLLFNGNTGCLQSASTVELRQHYTAVYRWEKSAATYRYLLTSRCLVQHSHNISHCSNLCIPWRCQLLWNTVDRNIWMCRLTVAFQSIVNSNCQLPHVCLSVWSTAWNKTDRTGWIVIIVVIVRIWGL